MSDNLTPEQRKRNMSRIRSIHTEPEIIVRSLIHRLGFRFRLHVRHLPGKPDVVFPSHKKVVFVHGCFWHMHSCKYGQVVPKTNTDYWNAKRLGNVRRDKMHISSLKKQGWKVLVLWECYTRKRSPHLIRRLEKFLNQ